MSIAENQTALEISADDVEEGPIRIDYTTTGVDDIELLHFIEKFALNDGFYDYYNQLLPTVFEHPNMKTNILWVENPTTGVFHPVNKRTIAESMIAKTGTSSSDAREGEDQQLENLPLIPKINLLEESSNGTDDLLVPPNPSYSNAVPATDHAVPPSANDQWVIIRMEYHHFNFMKRLLFLFFQGVLAGFCFVTFYIQISSNGNSTLLLNNYQPVAQEIRRFYYLISTISVIGSIDYIKTLWSSNTPSNPFTEYLSKDIAMKLEDYQKTTLFIGIIVLILHFISFIVSIIISFTDVQISLQFNYENTNKDFPTWTSYALDDTQFSQNIDQWITSDRVRIATGLLAWIGCCILLWRDVSRYRKMWLNLRRLRVTALAWMHRAKLLEGGSELEKLSRKELQELVNALEIGLQRAKTSLNVLERDQRIP